MVKYLMKSPLTAFIFAAVSYFVAVFLPYSEGYSGAMAAFQMPRLGYVFIIAYGLWLSVILAIIFSNARDKGIKLVLFSLLPLLGTQWAVPMLQQIQFGETTGTMTRFDLLLELSRGCAVTVFLMILALLLFKTEAKPAETKPMPPKAPDKYKIKKLEFFIKLLVLPIIYCVIYFIAWYFLLWRVDAVRVYYIGEATETGFMKEIINMLLTNAKLVPIAMIKGLLYTVCVITLLLQMEGKRVMFIITTVMLFAGPAVQMIIPNPIMPDAVRFAHAIELGADALVYGALAAFMLHTSVRKEVVAPPVAAVARPKPAKPVESAEPAEPAAASGK